MTQERENRKLKIVKQLLLKAGSTDSQEEAEALFVKAQELMIKWRIEENELKEDNSDDMTENEFRAFEFSLEGRWETNLAGVIAWANGCHYMWHTGNKTITLFGRHEDVQLVKHFIETSRDTFRRLSRNEYNKLKNATLKQYPKYDRKQLELYALLPYRSVYIRSFLNGCCEGLKSKIRKMTWDITEEQQVTSDYSLMLTNQVEKSHQHCLSKHKIKTQNIAGAIGHQGAFDSGIKAGQEHSLHIPVETSSTGATKTNLLN